MVPADEFRIEGVEIICIVPDENAVRTHHRFHVILEDAICWERFRERLEAEGYLPTEDGWEKRAWETHVLPQAQALHAFVEQAAAFGNEAAR